MDYIACQAPLSMGLPRQEYWSGLPFLSSGDLPEPGIKAVSPALAGRFSITEPPGTPPIAFYMAIKKSWSLQSWTELREGLFSCDVKRKKKQQLDKE